MKNEQEIIEQVKKEIRDVKDFPKEGILFKDITTALKKPEILALTIDWFVEKLKDKDIDYVIGLESRGFIFAPTIAYKIGAGFIPIRKPGKLPAEVEKVSYDLEYGTDTIEIHKDAIEKGKKVALVDDLLATGGTAEAAYKLVQKLGAETLSFAFMIELVGLKGKDKLPQDVDIFSMLKY
ncbi:MAG: adenine phosphoribosyltransferase [Alphaproteobacteria bacterium]